MKIFNNELTLYELNDKIRKCSYIATENMHKKKTLSCKNKIEHLNEDVKIRQRYSGIKMLNKVAKEM